MFVYIIDILEKNKLQEETMVISTSLLFALVGLALIILTSTGLLKGLGIVLIILGAVNYFLRRK